MHDTFEDIWSWSIKKLYGNNFGDFLDKNPNHQFILNQTRDGLMTVETYSRLLNMLWSDDAEMNRLATLTISQLKSDYARNKRSRDGEAGNDAGVS